MARKTLGKMEYGGPGWRLLKIVFGLPVCLLLSIMNIAMCYSFDDTALVLNMDNSSPIKLEANFFIFERVSFDLKL